MSGRLVSRMALADTMHPAGLLPSFVHSGWYLWFSSVCQTDRAREGPWAGRHRTRMGKRARGLAKTGTGPSTKPGRGCDDFQPPAAKAIMRRRG